MFRWIHDSFKPVYTISIAAELLECHPRTLRIYEAVGIIHPQRTQKKYRLFSQHDLKIIKKIHRLMAERSLNLPGVKALLETAELFDIEVESLLDKLLDE